MLLGEFASPPCLPPGRKTTWLPPHFLLNRACPSVRLGPRFRKHFPFARDASIMLACKTSPTPGMVRSEHTNTAMSMSQKLSVIIARPANRFPCQASNHSPAPFEANAVTCRTRFSRNSVLSLPEKNSSRSRKCAAVNGSVRVRRISNTNLRSERSHLRNLSDETSFRQSTTNSLSRGVGRIVLTQRNSREHRPARESSSGPTYHRMSTGHSARHERTRSLTLGLTLLASS